MQLCESCSEPITIQSAVRRNNRLLRRIVHILRTRVQTSKAYQDALFIELCSTSPAAENALREIRERAGIDCGPDDYDTIVERAVAALTTVCDCTQLGTSAHRDVPEADQ